MKAAAATIILVALFAPRASRGALKAGAGDKRWLDGLYLEVPEKWDDPDRFFRR
jgi:hypothetical protein